MAQTEVENNGDLIPDNGSAVVSAKDVTEVKNNRDFIPDNANQTMEAVMMAWFQLRPETHQLLRR